jgi:hypothetical protein
VGKFIGRIEKPIDFFPTKPFANPYAFDTSGASPPKAHTMKVYLTYLLLFVFCWPLVSIWGQQAEPSYFRLTAREAAQLYASKPGRQPDSSFLHSPVSLQEVLQDRGHFMAVQAAGEWVELSIQSNDQLQVELLNNSPGLALIVLDEFQQRIDSARVFLEGKELRFSATKQCFYSARAPQLAMLEVRLPGHSAYFELERLQKKPFFLTWHYRRFARTRIGTAITWPLRVVGNPVRYIVRSVRRGHWSNPWRALFPARRNKQLLGYIALNQPIYRPGDTLRLKAYVSSPKGRPLSQPLQFSLNKGWQHLLNRTLSAEAPGVYCLNLPLSDSLRIDQTYEVRIEDPDKNDRTALRYSFRLEDYELDEVLYEARASQNNFHRGEACTLLLSAKTSNELPVPDAQAEVYLLSRGAKAFFADSLVLPDTLWQIKESLGTRGLWQLLIPDTLVPPVSLTLECHVYFNNSAGQMGFKSLTLQFEHQTNRSTRVDRSTAQVQAQGLRSADSIVLQLRNPLRLPIWFQVKTRHGLVESGFFQDSIWQWARRDPSSTRYHLYYQVQLEDDLWREQESFHYFPKEMHIELEGPRQVLPGQEASYKVSVKRGRGQIARGVDLSAGAINAQFGDKRSFSEPSIGFRREQEPQANTRFESSLAWRKFRQPMTGNWVQRLHLQDSAFYRYRYSPQVLSIWRDSSLRQDSFYRRVAQFAPFLVKAGRMQPIFLIYANRKLVYYYDTQDEHPYSFAGVAGYNQITIRTREAEYRLDSVWLRRGEKLELVINEDHWPPLNAPPHIQRIAVPSSFTQTEKKQINESVFVFHGLGQRDSLFIWDLPQNIHFVAAPKQGYKVGPLTSGAALTYVHLDHFKRFLWFEPGFAYAVDENRERLYAHEVVPMNKNQDLPRTRPYPALHQQLISPQAVRSTTRRRPNYDTPPHACIRCGAYQFEYPQGSNVVDSVRLDLIVLYHPLQKSSWLLNPTSRNLPALESGAYELILRNSQGLVLHKNIQIRRDTLLYQNLSGLPFQVADSVVQAILNNHPNISLNSNPSSFSTPLPHKTYLGKTRLIRGTVKDASGEPLIGVSVLVKGTTIGTVTDLDGSYSLEVPWGNPILVMNYTGYHQQEAFIGADNRMDATLEESTQLLSEVVVTGYGAASVRGQTSAVASLSGMVAGVSILENKPISLLDNNPLSLDDLPLENSPELRQNFHDYAFWQPILRSNRRGEAFFSVKFPDDITSWKTFVLAADKNLQAGVYQDYIRAYKPLMAQLNVPRFLLHGDQSSLNGKVLNYTKDSIALRTRFQVAGQTLVENQKTIREGLVEKQTLVAPAQGDSLTMSYTLETAAQYRDGEQRTIPLHPIGTLEAEGSFWIIERDTVMRFQDKNGTIHFRAEPNVLALLLEDVNYLSQYPYACNEQSASKLLGLLAEKQIRHILQQPFTGEKMLQSLVARLGKAQNADGNWGWWPNSGSNTWMSTYVLQALIQAQQAGYGHPALEKGLRALSHTWPNQRGTQRLSSLQTLLLAGQKIDTTGLYDTLRLPQQLLCDHSLSLWVQQALGYPLVMDSLFKYQQKDVFGGLFWEEKNARPWAYHWDNNRLHNALLAYELFKKTGHSEVLRAIRTHLLGSRGAVVQGLRSPFGWRNTLEVARVLKTILPDLLLSEAAGIGKLNLSGAIRGEVDKQALQASFDAQQVLKMDVTGAGLFFCTAYQQHWNTKPAAKADLFAVNTYFTQNGEPISTLQFGKSAQLVVEVEAKQEGQYVMIEIPIPAGCSYLNKTQSMHYPEVHREYFAEKVSVFCETLPLGKHHFVVDLEPRFAGQYTLNPAKVEEMYFPTLYGRNEVEQVKIKP